MVKGQWMPTPEWWFCYIVIGLLIVVGLREIW